MSWLCWTNGYEQQPRTIEAESAEKAAEAYAAWYDIDRCEHKHARTEKPLPVTVRPLGEAVAFNVKCSARYHYEA